MQLQCSFIWFIKITYASLIQSKNYTKTEAYESKSQWTTWHKRYLRGKISCNQKNHEWVHQLPLVHQLCSPDVWIETVQASQCTSTSIWRKCPLAAWIYLLHCDSSFLANSLQTTKLLDTKLYSFPCFGV